MYCREKDVQYNCQGSWLFPQADLMWSSQNAVALFQCPLCGTLKKNQTLGKKRNACAVGGDEMALGDGLAFYEAQELGAE